MALYSCSGCGQAMLKILWKVLLKKKHLFSKNIRNYLIGAYKELCKGISIAFEAVLASIVTGTGLIGNV